VLHKLQKIATRALIHVTWIARMYTSFIGFTPTYVVHFVHKSLNHLLPTPNRWCIKRWCCLTSVCVTSVTYIVPKSRTERRRKTKIGTEVALVTRDSDTTFKVKRSRSPDRFTHRCVGASGSCISRRGKVLAVGNCCYVAVCLAALLGEEGRGHRDGRPPTA